MTGLRQLAEAVPELSALCLKYDSLFQSVSCQDCTKTKLTRGFLLRAHEIPIPEERREALIQYFGTTKEPESTAEIGLAKLTSNANELAARMTEFNKPFKLNTRPLTGNENTEAGERKPCLDCVCKHIAQAHILLSESRQGYPEHVEVAFRRLSLALASAKEGSETYKALSAAMMALSPVRPEPGNTQAADHVKKAKQLLEDALSSNSRRSLEVWKAIGHLGEAADEVVGESEMLAAAIRQERIMLMVDETYSPNLDVLLTQFLQIKESRNG